MADEQLSTRKQIMAEEARQSSWTKAFVASLLAAPLAVPYYIYLGFHEMTGDWYEKSRGQGYVQGAMAGGAGFAVVALAVGLVLWMLPKEKPQTVAVIPPPAEIRDKPNEKPAQPLVVPPVLEDPTARATRAVTEAEQQRRVDLLAEAEQRRAEKEKRDKEARQAADELRIAREIALKRQSASVAAELAMQKEALRSKAIADAKSNREQGLRAQAEIKQQVAKLDVQLRAQRTRQEGVERNIANIRADLGRMGPQTVTAAGTGTVVVVDRTSERRALEAKLKAATQELDATRKAIDNMNKEVAALGAQAAGAAKQVELSEAALASYGIKDFSDQTAAVFTPDAAATLEEPVYPTYVLNDGARIKVANAMKAGDTVVVKDDKGKMRTLKAADIKEIIEPESK